MATLNDLLDDAAREAPARTAVVTAEESLSFAELRGRVLRIAEGLRKAGVGKGDCVAIVHKNSPRFVEAYFAAVRLGAVAVPVNFMVQKAAELGFMLQDCGAKGVVTQKEFLRGLREASSMAPSLKNIWVTDRGGGEEGTAAASEKPFSALLADSSRPAGAEVIEDDVAAILYTSGTTGRPKGAMLTHKNLVSNAAACKEHLGLTSSDVFICLLPMFHSFAWTTNVVLPLFLKARVAVSPSIAPPRPWLGLMGRQGVTMLAAVPQLYAMLARQAYGFSKFVLRYWFFRKTRMAISGAAPLPPVISRAFEEALGIPILEGYGLTETSPVVSVNTPKSNKSGSVGRPIPGVEVKIVDENGAAVVAGREGEICVKGHCVMKGYRGLPEADREALTTDGWFKTGDIGFLDSEGYLFIRDRKKDMIIVKGLKVFPAMVEATISEHPAVKEAAVIGIPDEEGNETIKAFVVIKEGAAAGKAEILQYCRQKLDPYKRPRDIEIVADLPKNTLQKVLKTELREREMRRRSAASTADGG